MLKTSAVIRHFFEPASNLSFVRM